MITNYNDWPKIVIEATHDQFFRMVDWLDYHLPLADYRFIANISTIILPTLTHTTSFSVAFYIRDTAIAMLFKLTWV